MSAVDLVAQIIAESYDGCVVTRFVLVAEIIDHDGERAVCTETQDGATRWDTYGLLVEALQTEKAHQTAEAVAEYEADD